MSMENNQDVRVALADLSAGEGTLKERVRALVLDAVLRRNADPKALRGVLQDAVAGVGDGLGRRGEVASHALQEAMQGLDEAIGKSVYALQMALEEAWGQGRQFAQQDLREAADAVKDLEDDLLRTLKETADRVQGGVRDEFVRLTEHLRRTGTDTGSRVRDVLALLETRLGSAASGASMDAREAARTAASRLAEVTSGILRGLADAIDARKG
jgi:gas vesicle protein